ncbi:hypothetical protein CA235_10215 [Sphingomonas sp. ABOLF]|uniref:hypothetical protein n=1 Tax=Sphingomonas sp. ABOLF TaxID=1985879 RepID=UPI000F7ED3A5|nr:hypothetical protein [Sphingomonas sp. ABOLF]RSV14890.1 hypothetical protein CA235_10215 [Sphingomonas sp. ABOLF]
MTTTKHGKSEGEGPFTSDLEDDPGIGQSPGLLRTGADPDALEADNTQEGDVENDAGVEGEAREGDLGRSNP